MGIAVDLRNALYTAIEAKRGAGEYTYNSFVVEKTHKPFEVRESERLKDGVVHLMAGGFDESPVTRGLGSQPSGLVEVDDLPILIFMQRAVDGADSLENGDQFLNLLEQVSDTARDIVVAGATWARNTQMKDGDGYPYVFSLLREQSVLQVGFTAHYHYVWTS